VKALLQLAATLALLTVAVGVAVISFDTHRFMVHADSTVQHLDAVATEANRQLQADDAQIATLLASVDDAANEQRAYWQKTSADSDKTVKALRIAVDRASLLLDHTDKQLNGSLLPDADRHLNLTATAAQGALSSLDHASSALAFQVDQLDLGPALANFDESSARLANVMGYLQSASGHADNILGSGERTATYYEKKLTTPATFARKLSDFVLQSGSEARILFVGH
jgi:hypothetical protein